MKSAYSVQREEGGIAAAALKAEYEQHQSTGYDSTELKVGKP